MNNVLPVFNTRLLKAYADLDPVVVKLVKTVKPWAKRAGVQGAPAGNLSSYALTLMVIYFAQIRGALPVLQGDHVIPQVEQECNVAFAIPEGWRSAKDDPSPEEAREEPESEEPSLPVKTGRSSFGTSKSGADLSFAEFVRFYSVE